MDRLISCHHRYPAATHSIVDSSIKYKKGRHAYHAACEIDSHTLACSVG